MLGEPERQLLVVVEEAPHVRQDQHADAARRVGQGVEGGQAVAVGGRQLQDAVLDGRSREGLDGGMAVVVEAHGGRLRRVTLRRERP